MNLLHIDSSILGDHSVSRELSAKVVAHLKAANQDIQVTRLDLGETPLAHLGKAHIAAQHGGPVSAELQADLAAGTRALDTFLDADLVVIGVPMYNLGIPSQLKAWFDRICVAGKTFQYSDKGPAGLCGGKKVIIASARGGIFSEGTPMASFDHQETYLRTIFGFLGVQDIRFVRAEGVAMGEAFKSQAFDIAGQDIARLAA